MKVGPCRLMFAVCCMALTLAFLPAQGAEIAGGSVNGVVALFEGQPIDLSKGWGAAKACVVWEAQGVVECFRSEQEMDRRTVRLLSDFDQTVRSESTADDVLLLVVECSSSLRLYDGVGYVTPVLYILDRYQWINLSSYGFDNRTSSYRVGACPAYFADYTNGGGSWYPTSSTEAWDVSSSMLSGWNNRVSSVYIG